MKIKLKIIMEQNFLDFKRKYLNLHTKSQMRNGSNTNSNPSNDSNNSNLSINREQLNNSMQTITGNAKGVFAGTKESIGMLKNQEKNTALTSLNKTKKSINNTNNNINESSLLVDGIKKHTVKNMVHPYTKEKTSVIKAISTNNTNSTNSTISTNNTNNNTNNNNNNTNNTDNTDSFYNIKAKESSAFLTRGTVPYQKWRKPTKENPQGYPTPVMHNGFKRYPNG